MLNTLPQLADGTPAAIAAVNHALQGKVNGSENRHWAEIYRTYADDLRALLTDEEWRPTAQRLLNSLYINQSLPTNQLETPDHIDAYTGEIIEDPDEVEPDGVAPVIPYDQLPFDIYNAYDDPVMAEQAVAASYTKVDPMDDEHWPHEDRPDLPLYLQPEVEIDELGVIFSTIMTQIVMFENPALSKQRSRLHGKILSTLQWFHNTVEIPIDDLALAFLKLEELEIVSAADASLITTKHGSLRSYINIMYEVLNDDFLQEVVDKMFQSTYDRIVNNEITITPSELTEAEITQIADAMLDDLLSAIPENAPIQRSQAFARGFIDAASTGASFPETLDNAWNEWRAWFSPEANKTYHKVLDHHQPLPPDLDHVEDMVRAECRELGFNAEQTEETVGEKIHKVSKTYRRKLGYARKRAMAAFWSKAREQGLKTPGRKPKQVQAIAARGTGLILQSGRHITWRTACMILDEEGFDLTDDRKEKLLAILDQKNIGQRFARKLSE